MFRAPRVVLWLLVSFVAVFGAMAWLPRPVTESLIDGLAFYPARFTAIEWQALGWDWSSVQALAPLVTYGFLHGDLLHLAVNGLGFLAFGTPVARRLGNGSFLAFCLLTCVLSALAFWVVHRDLNVPMVGASGVISALVGGAVRFMFLDPRGEWGREGGLLPLTSPPVVSFSLIWLVSNFVLGVWGVGTTDPSQSIAWEAHMGGFVAGLLLLPLFDWRKPARSRDLFAFEEIR